MTYFSTLFSENLESNSGSFTILQELWHFLQPCGPHETPPILPGVFARIRQNYTPREYASTVATALSLQCAKFVRCNN